MGQGSAGGAYGREEVDGERPLPFVVREGEESARSGSDRADVVDEDVDSGGVVGRAGDEFGRPVDGGEIDGHLTYVVLLGEDVEFGASLQCTGNDARAFSGQGARDGQPDAPTCPGDQGGLAGQMQVHRGSVQFRQWRRLGAINSWEA